MRTATSAPSKKNNSLITQLEDHVKSNNVEEVQRLLYNFVTTKETISVMIAKALVKLVTHDAADGNVKKACFEFLDLMYEDKANGKPLQDSTYYISKVLGNSTKVNKKS